MWGSAELSARNFARRPARPARRPALHRLPDRWSNARAVRCSRCRCCSSPARSARRCCSRRRLACGERIIPSRLDRPVRACALCSQVIGQGLLVYALGHVPPLVVGIAMLTQPALSALLGWLYYGEASPLLDWTGAATIVVALVLVRLPQRACANRRQRPISAMDGRPTRSSSCAAVWRSPSARMRCSTAGPHKAVDSAAQPARHRSRPGPARLAQVIRGMIDAYIQGVDAALVAHFTPERIAAMKIRDRIRSLVWFSGWKPWARHARRFAALSILAMPQNVPLALRIGWRSADLMWRLAGDTATDFNHYTKRLTLGAVYGSTLLVWLDDQSEGWMETAAFLDRRLADVMKFEKWKAEWRGVRHPRLSPRASSAGCATRRAEALPSASVIDNQSQMNAPFHPDTTDSTS